MVMATGIVSIASHLLGFAHHRADSVLAEHPVLRRALGADVRRAACAIPQRVAADLLHHGRSVGFFTMVAGTCVLGSQFLIVGGLWSIAAVLWCLGIAAVGHPDLRHLHRADGEAEQARLAEGSTAAGCCRSSPRNRSPCWARSLSSGFGADISADVLLFCLRVARRRACSTSGSSR